jgi:hypothetical protein
MHRRCSLKEEDSRATHCGLSVIEVIGDSVRTLASVRRIASAASLSLARLCKHVKYYGRMHETHRW